MSRRQATLLAYLCFGIASAMVIVSFVRIIAAIFDDRYLNDIDYAYVVTRFAGNSFWNAGVFLVPGLVFYWLRDSLGWQESIAAPDFLKCFALLMAVGWGNDGGGPLASFDGLRVKRSGTSMVKIQG